MDVSAYAAPTAAASLEPTRIARRDLGPHDVLVAIDFSGICHSDIHQAREEWAAAIFPMVPGHEIAGRVQEVGGEVSKFRVGDHVGVGVFVDSCKECEACSAGLEQYCTEHLVVTYNGYELDRTTPTYGGYSTHIVVNERYVLRVPDQLPLDGTAPLLCAGITVYSPLRHWNVGPGSKVGVMGLGGLGHMGVQFAHALGAEVTLISHSPGKEEDGRELGAHNFILSSDKGAMKAAANSLDFIVNTVSANIKLDPYMNLLGLNGTMCLVGLPTEPVCVRPFTLTSARRSLAGSNIGSIAQTQEMLDFCGEHGITSRIETISADQINDAWDRVVNSDVRYRFIIDTATLPALT